ncbi:MAG: hypothetical protein U1E41_07980, partial [Paracoccus sp. (in: a-proteobacteria)]
DIGAGLQQRRVPQKHFQIGGLLVHGGLPWLRVRGKVALLRSQRKRKPCWLRNRAIVMDPQGWRARFT